MLKSSKVIILIKRFLSPSRHPPSSITKLNDKGTYSMAATPQARAAEIELLFQFFIVLSLVTPKINFLVTIKRIIWSRPKKTVFLGGKLRNTETLPPFQQFGCPIFCYKEMFGFFNKTKKCFFFRTASPTLPVQ